ncbi:ATP-dependent chaperone ClpB [Pelomyxa schiedti]|nr:ATP-dependent chaperone ClpB [Pelomyxa schiedti]
MGTIHIRFYLFQTKKQVNYIEGLSLNEQKVNRPPLNKLCPIRIIPVYSSTFPISNIKTYSTMMALEFGITPTKLNTNERDVLLQLPEKLHRRVIGQDKAVNTVARSIMTSGTTNKPLSFMFLGPSGVGKTEVARALAIELFDDESHMIRLDCSEYKEKNTVARLIGSPPGYVGYDQGGQLTGPVLRKPHSVVLFDEIEKADPELCDLLLQVLDYGRLTEAWGTTVDFSHTIVLLTSNIGSDIVLKSIPPDDAGTAALTPEVSNSVIELVRTKFRPEFLNGLTQLVIFQPLTRQNFVGIVELMPVRLAKRVKGANGVTLIIGDDDKLFVADLAYGSACQVETLLDEHIGMPIGNMLLSRDLKAGSTIRVTMMNNTTK